MRSNTAPFVGIAVTEQRISRCEHSKKKRVPKHTPDDRKLEIHTTLLQESKQDKRNEYFKLLKVQKN